MEKHRKHASMEDPFHDIEEADENNGDNVNNLIKRIKENNGTNARECMTSWSSAAASENNGLCLSNI